MIIKNSEKSIASFELLHVLNDKKSSFIKEVEEQNKYSKWLIWKAYNFHKRPLEAHLLELYHSDYKPEDFPEYRRVCRAIHEVNVILGMAQPKKELDIDEAKEYPILQLLSDYNLIIKKNFCNCPFHGENTASCKIYENTNSFYCFGCGKGGTVIDFVMGLNSCSFLEAVKYLLQ